MNTQHQQQNPTYKSADVIIHGDSAADKLAEDKGKDIAKLSMLLLFTGLAFDGITKDKNHDFACPVKKAVKLDDFSDTEFF